MPKEYVRLSPIDLPPALAKTLDDYSRTTGVSKSKIIRELLYKFCAPLMNDPDLTRRLEAVEAARIAARAAEVAE